MAITDNRDFMVIITTDTPETLKRLKDERFFKATHVVTRSRPLQDGGKSNEVWLVRMRLNNDVPLEDALKADGSKHRAVFIRYTSNSSYFSSDHADETAGSKLTGVRVKS
jgi:hypothetical protein